MVVSDLSRLLSLACMPADSFLFLGCAPHTPAREGRHPLPRPPTAGGTGATRAVGMSGAPGRPGISSPCPGRREAQPLDRCTICGGAVAAENGRVIANVNVIRDDDGNFVGYRDADADPLRDYEVAVTEHGAVRADGLVTVCGGCGRSHYDGTRAMDRAAKPSSGVPVATATVVASAAATGTDAPGRSATMPGAGGLAGGIGPVNPAPVRVVPASGRQPNRRARRLAKFGPPPDPRGGGNGVA
jgi:hypothetical protein